MLVYKYLSSTLNEDAIDVQLASSDVGDSFNKKQYKNRKGEFIDIDAVLDIIKFAVQDMNDNFPGSIGKILRRKPIVLTSDPRIKRMATDGCNIFVNPHWIIYLMNVDGIGEDYIVEAVAFVLAHEALHIIFRHVYDEHSTDQYADHNRANVSQDCQINLYIKPLVEKWNYAIVRYGKTGLGEALEDLFVMAGITAIAYPEQGKNKERLVENLTTLVNDGKFKVHNVSDLTEEAIRQFEDYIYSISEKGKTIVYCNGTSGMHDDAVSAAYFAVADVVVNSVEEAINYYD